MLIGMSRTFFKKGKKLNRFMNYRGISEHVEFANQTLKWFSTDCEKTFHWHLRRDYNKVEESGWLMRKVDYTFNSLGFRCDEINASNKSIVFLGGSEVVGTGLPLKYTFADIVANELGLNCINLAQSGAANDTVYRLASYWLPKLQPKLVVILSPPPYRIEVINTFLDKPITFYLPEYNAKDSFFKTWLSCDDNSVYNEEKNKIAVEYICKSNKLKLISFDDTEFETLDYARDFIHKGIESHQAFAEKILSMV